MFTFYLIGFYLFLFVMFIVNIALIKDIKSLINNICNTTSSLNNQASKLMIGVIIFTGLLSFDIIFSAMWFLVITLLLIITMNNK